MCGLLSLSTECWNSSEGEVMWIRWGVELVDRVLMAPPTVLILVAALCWVSALLFIIIRKQRRRR